ncbi:MarR family transcriptional regulator [Aggregicoccus sp. 17bor-14]|uniref:MarR family winged helix-turn-helix transcriptional regulator n=1 Tax=Myxococcaceae TaxID=31 RepID=UPI00129CFDAF|nr:MULTISPECIES: MarR family transcriptional regulator [Myxococcaceae]MBF5044295.1 MarR family transcriptional regulator [Simulacricoccus sp. 17bor-14]MRI90044.1 MarR family transcriptional regulator [Aggregicoccus sp. 17bor-14]
MTLAEQVASVRRTLQRVLTRHLAHKTPRSFLELRALKAIEHEDIRTQVALADRLLVDTAGVSRMVAKLEQEGLLERQPGDDRRCVRLELTATGRAQAQVLLDELQSLDAQVRRHLSEREVETLGRLLAKLHVGLNALAEEARRPGTPRGEA